MTLMVGSNLFSGMLCLSNFFVNHLLIAIKNYFSNLQKLVNFITTFFQVLYSVKTDLIFVNTISDCNTGGLATRA